MKKTAVLVLLGCISVLYSYAQTATVTGTVKDYLGMPLPYAHVYIQGERSLLVSADTAGRYQLKVPAARRVVVVVSYVGFENETRSFNLKENETVNYSPYLNPRTQRDTIFVGGERFRGLPTVSIDPEHAKVIATVGDPVIALVKSQLGVNNNSELGTGYSVRGGNFDENLIYINDVEVYRPFLARSGQQEGLSFINSDMVSQIAFSSGGFEARYGDKMSSVLDITYRKPTSFAAGGNIGVLGGSAYVQAPLFKKRLQLNLGGRYRSNNYLLRFMDTRGEYKPRFYDFQGQATFLASEKVDISVMGIYSSNQYIFFPQSRETSFGTITQTYKLRVAMGGRELTDFTTGMGALTIHARPSEHVDLKFIGSYTQTKESERFDIQGSYLLGELDNNPASDTYGDITSPVGAGGFMNHARNFLEARIMAFDHKGIFSKEKYSVRWGMQYKNELVQDKLREWNMSDSAAYLLPYYGPQDDKPIAAQNYVSSDILLQSHRVSAYSEFNYRDRTKDSTLIMFNIGLRAQWWSVNQEWLISPRMQLAITPNWKKRNMIFRVAGGVYYQAPFYRELRDVQGNINTSVKAQRSIMALAGTDYYFKIWKRPFKLTAEAYYKYLTNLNPYELDNIRIRYYAQNNARGFAYGADVKLNGEFIRGVESWATLSFMQTKEDIQGDYYYKYYDINGAPINPGSSVPAFDSTMVSPGYIPRPTDQRVTLSIFFQDNIPRLPQVKVSLNLVLGTGWPYGPPSQNRYSDTLRMPFYRRVDIGFLYEVISPDIKYRSPKMEAAKKHIRRAAFSLEIYNLLGINNTVSYNWIRDYQGFYYSVPNYLTPRLFNLKFTIDFK